jgi:hypothetical protein
MGLNSVSFCPPFFITEWYNTTAANHCQSCDLITASHLVSVGHETKSFERCKAILMSRVFGGFRVFREYFANVSDAASVGLDGQHCKLRFLRPLLDVPT